MLVNYTLEGILVILVNMNIVPLMILSVIKVLYDIIGYSTL
jgi:hypothetical protein